MGTTTRYAIPFPAGSDPPAGATQMQALAEKVDSSLYTVDTKPIPYVPGRVTSTTRPSVKVDGDMIYETDTHRLLVWNAAAAKWRGVRSTRFEASGGGGTTPNANDSPVVVCSVTIPDQGCDGWVHALWNGYFSQGVATDAFFFHLKGGTALTVMAQWRNDYPSSPQSGSMTLSAPWQMPAGGPQTIQVTAERKSGSGTVTVYPDGALNKISCIFTPDT